MSPEPFQFFSAGYDDLKTRVPTLFGMSSISGSDLTCLCSLVGIAFLVEYSGGSPRITEGVQLERILKRL